MRKVITIILTITFFVMSMSCENKSDNVVVAKLTMALDDLEDLLQGNAYPNFRSMLLKYELINNTSNRYFLPMNEYYGYKSKIIVNLRNSRYLYSYEVADERMTYNIINKKTGKPEIKEGFFIEPNDTGRLFFFLRGIRIKKREKCLMPTKKLLKALSMHYELDSADITPDSLPVPKVVFVNDTNDITVYYKMPPIKLEKK